MRGGCAVQTSKPVTTNAQVLSSLPGHHLAASLVELHTQHGHGPTAPQILWVFPPLSLSVISPFQTPIGQSLPAKLWGAVAQEAQDSWNVRCNDHQTGLFWRQRHGSNAVWQECLHKWCHQGATWSHVCKVIVRCN